MPTKLTVVNKSGVDRILRWIDERGRIEDYGTIKAGQQATVDTFLDNPWLITDEDRQDLLPGDHASSRRTRRRVHWWKRRGLVGVSSGETAAKKATMNKSKWLRQRTHQIDGKCIKQARTP